MVFSHKSAKISEPADGITRRILAHSPELMLTEHVLEKGAILPEHKHPHVQMVYLLKGKLLLEMKPTTYTCKDSVIIRRILIIKAVALVKSVAWMFCPAKEDYYELKPFRLFWVSSGIKRKGANQEITVRVPKTI
jgi:hypothetical protein